VGLHRREHETLTESETPAMANKPSNHGKQWSVAEVARLAELAKGNTPTRVIEIKLDRTPAAVQNKAGEEGISLKPVNQRPYGTRKKGS